ncbi:MAG: hypothetical protein ACNY01_02890 [Desulfobacteria bacterium]
MRDFRELNQQVSEVKRMLDSGGPSVIGGKKNGQVVKYLNHAVLTN